MLPHRLVTQVVITTYHDDFNAQNICVISNVHLRQKLLECQVT